MTDLAVMIKYEIQLGSKASNMKARNLRDGLLRPMLRGMHCRQCKLDTIIGFEIVDGCPRYDFAPGVLLLLSQKNRRQDSKCKQKINEFSLTTRK